MRALVTGSAGFVGTHLLAHLHACGDDVVAVDRSTAGGIDVTEAPALRGAVADAAPDVVYHLAARSDVRDSWNDSTLDDVNVGGTANVVDACVRSGVPRVLVVGSAEEYGVVDPADLPIAEHVRLRPITPYGRSKVAAEEVARRAFVDHGLGVVCVRAFNHTGPGQPPAFLVPGIAARVVAAERLGHDEIVVGNLEPVRDFTDVRDVVRAYRLLARLGEPGAVYNVCSGNGTSVDEIVRRLLARARRPLGTRVDPDLVRPVDVPVLVGDPGALVAATGWAPELPLDRTLGDVLDRARQAPSGT